MIYGLETIFNILFILAIIGFISILFWLYKFIVSFL